MSRVSNRLSIRVVRVRIRVVRVRIRVRLSVSVSGSRFVSGSELGLEKRGNGYTYRSRR